MVFTGIDIAVQQNCRKMLADPSCGKLGRFTREFRPEYYSRNQIPVDYDAKAKCPRFLEELLSPALAEETRQEDIDLLSMCFGLFILGINLPGKILILDGAARSGKSTVAKVAGLLAGERNRTMLRTEQLGGRFETFGFLGRTLLMGADVEPKFLLKPGASMLKSLVGGDMLTAEAKTGNERFDFRGCFNVLITANSALRVKIEGDRGSWRDRIVIVRFQEHTPAKRIEGFENVLFREEGAGILNWALDGLRRVLAAIYDGDGNFPLSKAQWERVEDLLAQSEALESFLRERVEVAEGCHLTKPELREEFGDYCRVNGWECPPKNEIGGRLPVLMKQLFGASESHSVPEGGKQVYGYYGVGWREVTD